MPVVRTAVMLATVSGMGQVKLLPPPWYVQYFFNPNYGQAAYWLKQTDNQVLFTGEVFDWLGFANEGEINLRSRDESVATVVKRLERERGVDFRPFDLVVFVAGLPDGLPAEAFDGGSTDVDSAHQGHHGIATRTGDPFDFVAHELGHGIKLQHSFGAPSFQASGEDPGGYGHPYCIMSAMAYGGLGDPFITATPRDGRKEYNRLGPSLNATTALGRGWLSRHLYDLAATDGPVELDLRSRHFGGKDEALPPQALEIRGKDGQTYVVEFRENAGWDLGQPTPMVIVAHGKGSTADKKYGGTHSTTFMKLIPLPVALGSAKSYFNGPGFCVTVVGRSPGAHTVRVRVQPGMARPAAVGISSSLRALDSRFLDFGDTTWEPGERFCTVGTWRYEKFANSEIATIEMTCDQVVPPLTGVWTVDGIAIGDLSGTLTLKGKKVDIATPKLDSKAATADVEVGYKVTAMSNGSRLELTNRSQDETYTLAIEGGLYDGVGSATRSSEVSFTGIEYRYGQDFWDAWGRCSGAWLKERIPNYEVTLPEDWDLIPKERFQHVQTYLDVLGSLRDAPDL